MLSKNQSKQQIPAYLHRAVLFQYVKIIQVIQHVLVFKIILEALPIVDQNVQSPLNVDGMNHALHLSVKVLVLALAGIELFVMLLTILPRVAVLKDILVTHLPFVLQNH